MNRPSNQKWVKVGNYRVHCDLNLWVRFNADGTCSVLYRLFDTPLILTYSANGWAKFSYQIAMKIARQLERQLVAGVLRVA